MRLWLSVGYFVICRIVSDDWSRLMVARLIHSLLCCDIKSNVALKVSMLKFSSHLSTYCIIRVAAYLSSNHMKHLFPQLFWHDSLSLLYYTACPPVHRVFNQVHFWITACFFYLLCLFVLTGTFFSEKFVLQNVCVSLNFHVSLISSTGSCSWSPLPLLPGPICSIWIACIPQCQ